MGKSLHMRVVAEGVETQEQLSYYGRKAAMRHKGISSASRSARNRPGAAAGRSTMVLEPHTGSTRFIYPMPLAGDVVDDPTVRHPFNGFQCDELSRYRR
jgi:hypothetical protein